MGDDNHIYIFDIVIDIDNDHKGEERKHKESGQEAKILLKIYLQSGPRFIEKYLFSTKRI